MKTLKLINILFIALAFSLTACQTAEKNTVTRKKTTLSKKAKYKKRTVSSTDKPSQEPEGEYVPMDILKKSYKVEDSQWGTYTIDTIDYGEPVFAPIELKVTLLCNDQKKAPSAINKPKPEVLTKAGFKVCEYEGHRYDSKTKVLSIDYKVQSEVFDPDAETCNEAYTEEFDFKRFCKQWLPLEKQK